MAGYDATKDKTIREILVEDGEFKVSLVSYDGGDEKIAIMKRGFAKDGTPYYAGKIGRVHQDTAIQISHAITELVKTE